jgi:hypothetical protein
MGKAGIRNGSASAVERGLPQLTAVSAVERGLPQLAGRTR